MILDTNSKNSADLSLIKELLLSIDSVDDTLTKLDIHEPKSIDDIYDTVKDSPHGAYISVWLLGLLAKEECSWALATRSLSLLYKNISEIPPTIQHLINLEQILLAYNPIQDWAPLVSLPSINEVIVSVDQANSVLNNSNIRITYTSLVLVSLDQGSPSAGPEMVPPAIQQAKVQYILGTTEGHTEALELVRPFINAYYISDNVYEFSESYDPVRLDEDEVVLTHLDIRFDTNSKLPFIGAAGVTLFFFEQDPATEFETIVDFVGDGVSIELDIPEDDFLPTYDGWYRVDLVENQKEYYLPKIEHSLFPTLSRFIL